MTNVVVVGSQWGDEGKGKVVDWLCERAEIVVRFQGGHNAGHTLVIDGRSYKLSVIPSGIVRSGKIAVIGNGVVVDPWALLSEIQLLRSQGIEITTENLKIAENAALILPLHRELDRAREDSKKSLNIGTTRRGIGPAYEDKIGRRAIRICDLRDTAALDNQVNTLLSHHNALRAGFGQDPIDPQSIHDLLGDIAPQLLPYACPVWQLLDKALNDGQKILFEGAQGTMLDVDHGTYPFVTSTNTLAGHAAVGSGIKPSAINYVLGITKSYTTRVGAGPFPSELTDHIGQLLGERGFEFGTVTGRARRCGWFDAVIVRQAVKIGGITGIALTKLDILDDFSEINICTGYKLGDQLVDYLPTSREDQQKVVPVYETLRGWQKSLKGMRRWDDLPAEAQMYVRKIESLIQVPVSLISTSPERDDTILIHDPFAV